VSAVSDIEKQDRLQSNSADYVASAAKAFLGTAPFIGSILSELAGTVIPNQRTERIVKFARILERRVSRLEEDFVRAQINNEQFADLLEEGLRQSARSLSGDRREYIAAVIANSLTSQDIEYIESKHLLHILDDINDVEVVWLRSYLNNTMGGDSEFRETHENVIAPISASMGSSQQELDKETLQISYKEHLVRLGLLKRRYKIDRKTKAPQYNLSSGAQEIAGYEITPLGKLLLRQIELGLEN
jgi:hypothetical protein